MATVERQKSATGSVGSIQPSNPLQSDFTVNDTDSMDDDERYLV